MPGRKLRVFQAQFGFYDTVVAASSQAAALRSGVSTRTCSQAAAQKCPRRLEMKVEEIEARFGAYRGLRLVDLLAKLTCGEPKGCGSTDMVLFPWKEKPSLAKPKAEKDLPPELPF